jgi:hypothetical protein
MSKKHKEKLYVEIDEQLKMDLQEKVAESKTQSSVAQVVREILNGYFKRQRRKKST